MEKERMTREDHLAVGEMLDDMEGKALRMTERLMRAYGTQSLEVSGVKTVQTSIALARATLEDAANNQFPDDKPPFAGKAYRKEFKT